MHDHYLNTIYIYILHPILFARLLFDFFFFLFLQGKKITNDCVEMVNTITEEELCANPTIITTPYINLTACIEKATEMKVSKLLKGENGVKLPDAKDLFPGDQLDENTVVDVKVFTMNHL